MAQLIERSSNGAFDQLDLSERIISEAQKWHQEDPEAFARLFASLYGIEVNGYGKGTRPPTAGELYVGKTLAHTKTMSDAGTLYFGFLSNDFNPLHFNEALAQRTRFKGRIAHGFHTASLFSGVLAELCPWCVYLRQEMEFTAPVRAGDRITATGVIEELDERGVLTVGLQCTNQRDEVVVRGKAILKKLKEVYE
jgi:3-hydroxybutyryl-CoA dehydratase